MKEDSLTVHLGDRSYPIRIGRGLETTIISEVDSLCKEGKKVVALIDQGLVEGNPEFCSKLLLSLPTFEVPRGETSKSVAILEKVCGSLSGGGGEETISVGELFDEYRTFFTTWYGGVIVGGCVSNNFYR